jgi:hypothetical protein
MIKQVIKNEQELRDLIYYELSNSNYNKHFIDESEVTEIIDEIVEDFKDEEYPKFIFGDLTFRLNGLDLFLESYFESFTKEEIEDFLKQFDE